MKNILTAVLALAVTPVISHASVDLSKIIDADSRLKLAKQSLYTECSGLFEVAIKMQEVNKEAIDKNGLNQFEFIEIKNILRAAKVHHCDYQVLSKAIFYKDKGFVVKDFSVLAPDEFLDIPNIDMMYLIELEDK